MSSSKTDYKKVRQESPPDAPSYTTFAKNSQDSTNRLYSPGDIALTDDSLRRIRYDAAGNQTKDTYTGYGTATFDGDNHIVAIADNSGGTSYYTYNANGQRVRRKIGTAETWQIYGIDGELVAEYAANGAAGSPQKEYGYRNGQLLITAEPPAAPSNVVLAANGSTVTASSTRVTPPYSYPVTAVSDGDRKGLNAGYTGNWHSSTATFPQWVQVDFNGSKTISEVDVFSLQDNYPNPIEPTETTTFTLYGLTGFDIQYWTGSAWATVSGGSVTGNNKVWKKVTFAPLTTSKVRVLINATADGWSRMVELEAWTSTTTNTNWLVTDHLGTPRMILDQTGSLANVKRHDYSPFGEELFPPTGLRNATLGYTSEGIRQKFTQKERDIETGLDYFGARYYSNVQGRFTSADAPFMDQSESDPQSWNLYSYVRNNPLRLLDPTGRSAEDKCDSICQESRKKAEEARQQAEAEGIDTVVINSVPGNNPFRPGSIIKAELEELERKNVINEKGWRRLVGSDPSLQSNSKYTNYTEGIGNFAVGMIVQDSRIHPTFSFAPSWPNFSLSETTGQGPVSPGLYGQGTVGNYGLVVNESINLLHPTSGLSTEVGWGTPQASAGIQIIFPALNGMTPRDWLHHPDNPVGKGPEGRGGGRCPY